MLWRGTNVNTLRPRQNGCHFPDDIINCIFLTENVWISIKISMKIVPKGPINNIPSLVQIMAWRRSGDKPLSETIMANLLTHICVTRPQWFNPCTESKKFVWLITAFRKDIALCFNTDSSKPLLVLIHKWILNSYMYISMCHLTIHQYSYINKYGVYKTLQCNYSPISTVKFQQKAMDESLIST